MASTDKSALEAALRSAGFHSIRFSEVGAGRALVATVLGRKWHSFAIHGMSISEMVEKFRRWDAPPKSLRERAADALELADGIEKSMERSTSFAAYLGRAR